MSYLDRDKVGEKVKEIARTNHIEAYHFGEEFEMYLFILSFLHLPIYLFIIYSKCNRKPLKNFKKESDTIVFILVAIRR